MVARLLDENPERAYEHAKVALRLASRVAAVREAAGFAAYATGKYSEALTEFRAARRMTGSQHLWPMMADCERGIGRPERALAMAGEPEVRQLDKAGQVEMRLVAAGARLDMGQAEAAVVTLQSPELASRGVQPWTARLRYAYGDALLAVGREEEARDWFARALEADQDGATDASDRLAELDGIEFVDALDPDSEDEPEPGTVTGDEVSSEASQAQAVNGEAKPVERGETSVGEPETSGGLNSEGKTADGEDAQRSAPQGEPVTVTAGASDQQSSEEKPSERDEASGVPPEDQGDLADPADQEPASTEGRSTRERADEPEQSADRTDAVSGDRPAEVTVSEDQPREG